MHKIIVLLLVLLVNVFSVTPEYLWVGSYTIEHYNNGVYLAYSHKQASAFTSLMSWLINWKNLDIDYKWNHNYKDAAVNETVFEGQDFNINEFLIFVSHGYRGGMVINKYNTSTTYAMDISNQYPNTRSWDFGNSYTKWIIMGSCHTILDEHVTVWGTTFYFYDQIFDGVHSIMGYKSDGRNVYDGGPIGRFPLEWVHNRRSIWNAWRVSVREEVYEGCNQDVTPSMVGVWGTVNGQDWDADTELFYAVYDALTPHNETLGAWIGYGMMYRHVEYGDPEY